jgi:hypothetical protein
MRKAPTYREATQGAPIVLPSSASVLLQWLLAVLYSFTLHACGKLRRQAQAWCAALGLYHSAWCRPSCSWTQSRDQQEQQETLLL